MPDDPKESIQLLQGTLDLIVLRNLDSMGPQHAYQIASRLQQVSQQHLSLNQGTLYPALVRLEQRGWIQSTWNRTESGRDAKFYGVTRSGLKAMKAETERWRRLAGFVERLLVEER
jgi:transcriptional regulator